MGESKVTAEELTKAPIFSEVPGIALVTGSTSGIGLATAGSLLRQGWKVQLHGATENLNPAVENLLRLFPDSCAYSAADLREPATAAAQLRQEVLLRWGRLDALVSNAAMTHTGPLEGITESDWLDVLKVNLLASFFLIKELGSTLAEASGAAVLVSSTNAKRVNHNNIIYDVSKAALNHLGRSLALELRESGVRVNIVMPGGTLTPMLENWMTEVVGDRKSAQHALKAEAQKGLLAEPEQIANAIVSLLSPESAWVTGAAIELDGGAFLGEYWSD